MTEREEIDTQLLYECYEDMLFLRRFEEKAGQLYGMGMIGGFCHLYIGQEAVAVGISKVLKKGDTVITSYRDHGFMLGMKSDHKAIMAELLGKKGGCSKGKGGSMHMFDVEKGFFGGHGIVGAQVSIGTGIALSLKYKKKNSVSITVLGDGAINQGQVYESFNMAKVWGLPVLYIIENNQYAMGSSIAKTTSTKELCRRGEGFGILGKSVNGMDLIKVYEETKKAAEYVRENSTPMILECLTYRYRGHSMSDPANYRTKEEVNRYKEDDPITNLQKYMEERKIWNEDLISQIKKRVKEKVDEAVKFAQESEEPDSTELFNDVYV